MIRFWVIVVFVFSLSCGVKGQRVLRNTSILNYQRGDRTFVHFGFTLGVNYMDYRMVFSGKNSLRGETGKLDVGFLVGIVSELRVTDDLGLRFCRGWNLPHVGQSLRMCLMWRTIKPKITTNRYILPCL